MANREAGKRFEEYIRIAIARSKTIHSPADLFRATRMSRNTLYDLFNGDTETPGPKTMAALATALEVPMADLWAVWQGLEITPDSMQEALARHTRAVDRQSDLLNELVGYIRSSAIAIIEAGGDAEHVRAARVAIDAAREDPPEAPEDDPPDEPVAFVPRRIPDGGTPPRSRR